MNGTTYRTHSECQQLAEAVRKRSTQVFSVGLHSLVTSRSCVVGRCEGPSSSLTLAPLIVRHPLEGSQNALHSPLQRWCGMTNFAQTVPVLNELAAVKARREV